MEIRRRGIHLQQIIASVPHGIGSGCRVVQVVNDTACRGPTYFQVTIAHSFDVQVRGRTCIPAHRRPLRYFSQVGCLLWVLKLCFPEAGGRPHVAKDNAHASSGVVFRREITRVELPVRLAVSSPGVVLSKNLWRVCLISVDGERDFVWGILQRSIDRCTGSYSHGGHCW